MENKQRVIVLSAVPYSFTADNGITYTGCSLTLVESEVLKPREDEKGNKGYVPMKTSIPEVLCESLKAVPAVYDVTFNLVSDQRKGLVAKVSEIAFVRECVPASKTS